MKSLTWAAKFTWVSIQLSAMTACLVGCQLMPQNTGAQVASSGVPTTYSADRVALCASSDDNGDKKQNLYAIADVSKGDVKLDFSVCTTNDDACRAAVAPSSAAPIAFKQGNIVSQVLPQTISSSQTTGQTYLAVRVQRESTTDLEIFRIENRDGAISFYDVSNRGPGEVFGEDFVPCAGTENVFPLEKQTAVPGEAKSADAGNANPSGEISLAQLNVNEINKYRALGGLAPLSLDDNLSRFAQLASDDLARTRVWHGYFSSHAPDWNYMSSFGFGAGYSENQGGELDLAFFTPAQAVIHSMRSMYNEGPQPRDGNGNPIKDKKVHGHYETIMNSNFTRVGVAFSTSNNIMFLSNDFSP